MVMIPVIYLVKMTIKILMPFNRLEQFLMSVELIFLVKKQRELKNNFTKKESFMPF